MGVDDITVFFPGIPATISHFLKSYIRPAEGRQLQNSTKLQGKNKRTLEIIHKMIGQSMLFVSMALCALVAAHPGRVIQSYGNRGVGHGGGGFGSSGVLGGSSSGLVLGHSGGASHLGGAGIGGSHLGGAGIGGSHIGGVGTSHLGGAGIGGSHLGGSGIGGSHLGGAGIGGSHLGSAGIGGSHLGGVGVGSSHLGGSSIGVGLGGASHLGGSSVGVNHLGGAGIGGVGVGSGVGIGSTSYNPAHYPDIVPGYSFQTSYPGRGFGGCQNWCRSTIQRNYYCCTRTSYAG